MMNVKSKSYYADGALESAFIEVKQGESALDIGDLNFDHRHRGFSKLGPYVTGSNQMLKCPIAMTIACSS